jgi:hypothetical protein
MSEDGIRPPHSVDPTGLVDGVDPRGVLRLLTDGRPDRVDDVLADPERDPSIFVFRKVGGVQHTLDDAVDLCMSTSLGDREVRPVGQGGGGSVSDPCRLEG